MLIQQYNRNRESVNWPQNLQFTVWIPHKGTQQLHSWILQLVVVQVQLSQMGGVGLQSWGQRSTADLWQTAAPQSEQIINDGDKNKFIIKSVVFRFQCVIIINIIVSLSMSFSLKWVERLCHCVIVDHHETFTDIIHMSAQHWYTCSFQHSWITSCWSQSGLLLKEKTQHFRLNKLLLKVCFDLCMFSRFNVNDQTLFVKTHLHQQKSK